jgi:hypothetical protein
MSENSKGFGYKVLDSSDIGPYVKVEYDLIQNKDLPTPAKLVYAFLKTYENRADHTAVVSMDTLVRKSGYSKATINKSIRELESSGVISTKRMSNKKAGRGYNKYTLNINGGMFAMMTLVFVESKNLTCKEKEFILLVFPYILDNDTIGSLDNPYDPGVIAEKTGLSTRVVVERIKDLKLKNLIKDHYTKTGTHGRSFFVGYKFNMFDIMLSNTASIKEERDRFRSILEEKGLRY